MNTADRFLLRFIAALLVGCTGLLCDLIAKPTDRLGSDVHYFLIVGLSGAYAIYSVWAETRRDKIAADAKK